MSIKLYDISNKKFIEENVPAENFMRFLYDNPFGRFATWALFKRAFFSKICGLWADSSISKGTIASFVKSNNIDENEFLLPQSSYKTFNDFFTRELKDGAREIAEKENPNVISLPSDGRHLLVKNITEATSFYVKGQKFNLAKFLGNKKLAEAFEGSDMLISRLAPVDYHRFHFAISGEIVARKQINGALLSVSPIALVPRLSVFWENKRVLNVIDNAQLGHCLFVEIGATNVGSIVNFSKIGDNVERGQQAGMFRFGGSCVVSLFPKDRITWDETLLEMSQQNIECYGHVGMKCGVISNDA